VCAGGSGDDYNDDDEEGGGGRKTKGGGSGSSSGITLKRPLVIAGRTERVAVGSHAGISEWFRLLLTCCYLWCALTAGPGLNGVGVRYQWTLSAQPNGALAFTAFPFASPNMNASSAPSSAVPGAPASGGTLTAPSVVSTAADALPLGEWRHVAIVLDATAAAKEVAARLKAAGATGAAPSEAPLPDAAVRLYVDGVSALEGEDDNEGVGRVRTAMPLPPLDPIPSGTMAPAAAGEVVCMMRILALIVRTAGAQPQPLVPPASIVAGAAGTTDHLLLGPDLVGRIGEVTSLTSLAYEQLLCAYL
jgi:hypothetical protein